MLLSELTNVAGGMHSQMASAVKNMEHHAKKHKDERIRVLSASAAAAVKKFQNLPASQYQDPHTLVKALSCMQGEPDHAMLSSAVATLGSYVENDSD